MGRKRRGLDLAPAGAAGRRSPLGDAQAKRLDMPAFDAARPIVDYALKRAGTPLTTS